ncbi:dihydrofolate reductase [Mumia flava]|uniref:Dihydrofolate reductase n=1 Tax=Mumia flava TaxID=1348852 RepID=A0A0B2B2P9_9ACTN|nr:dihydrofolate reductase family protein [Mumia flava]PJJ57724.1 dihydrofolate reductase [Mumia flava]
MSAETTSAGPVRYSINVTLDGCCDHRAVPGDDELHRHAADRLAEADALLFGRVTYEMMEAAFRIGGDAGADPADPFVRTMDAAKKYVVSSTLESVDWNAELVRGDLPTAVRTLAQSCPRGVFVGGVQLAQQLTELGLVDEYEIVVHPWLAGHGPTLFAGLTRPLALELVGRQELASGAVAMRYVPRRSESG